MDNLGNGLQRSLTWNDIWKMVPLLVNFIMKSAYDVLLSGANRFRWGKVADQMCSLCSG